MMNKVFACVLALIAFGMISGCGGGKSSTGPGGDGTDLGIISTLNGGKTQLVLEAQTGAEPRFTTLFLFGLNSCVPSEEVAASVLVDQGNDWWQLTFDIPIGVDLTELYRFGFVDADEVWLNAGLCTIETTAVEVWEGAFAFVDYIGNSGDCYPMRISLTGDTTCLTLTVDNGHPTNPQYTTVVFWQPTSKVDVYALEATSVNDTGDGVWEITFDIPGEADLPTRWAFGFQETGTYNWMPVDGTIVSGSVVIYAGNFAFREYCGCT